MRKYIPLYDRFIPHDLFEKGYPLITYRKYWASGQKRVYVLTGSESVPIDIGLAL